MSACAPVGAHDHVGALVREVDEGRRPGQARLSTRDREQEHGDAEACPEATVARFVEPRVRVEHDLEGPGAEVPGADPAGREAQEAVRRAVEQLPEGERECLVLSEYNGLKYAEISEILGIPEGTVKSRMFSALRRIREALKNYRA